VQRSAERLFSDDEPAGPPRAQLTNLRQDIFIYSGRDDVHTETTASALADAIPCAKLVATSAARQTSIDVATWIAAALSINPRTLLQKTEDADA
jgi:hypothetical protein